MFFLPEDLLSVTLLRRREQINRQIVIVINNVLRIRKKEKKKTNIQIKKSVQGVRNKNFSSSLPNVKIKKAKTKNYNILFFFFSVLLVHIRKTFEHEHRDTKTISK